MRNRAARPLRLGVGCLIGALALSPAPAGAQFGVIHGLVTDTTGAPIDGAAVSILALQEVTRTNSRGRFAFRRVPPGATEVFVRRLGFMPASVSIIVTESGPDSMHVTLIAQPVVLTAITAAERRRRQGIDDFHFRRARGTGTYFTREEILARHASVPSDVIRMTPGIRVVHVRGGSRGIRFVNSQTMRRDCVPMMWLDGQRTPGLELDDVPVNDIEGIELYNGPATTPMQFSHSPSITTCGTIVIWTRTPGF